MGSANNKSCHDIYQSKVFVVSSTSGCRDHGELEGLLERGCVYYAWNEREEKAEGVEADEETGLCSDGLDR